VEGEECYQGPELVKNYHLELERETRVLHEFMQNLLAGKRDLLVLYFLLP
jgi:hypothetical protein